ncbi:hypothetical protein MHZ92_06115 [Sporosarcina sp. ACRSL]|uniref:hypothetical protein n=1 Tax=Sporosarcina sp. ACRSL TaxID=2918215 RepID=UPI001EF410A4|nr:hypothetical protein [Sporosarcina sp. ACRSL]MCG7343699.1 hypothetical protein [Sporosarcina sp. ACRSL]
MQTIKNALLILLTITVCVLTYYNLTYQKQLKESNRMINSTLKENSNLEAQLRTAISELQLADAAEKDFPMYSSDELALTGYAGTKQDVIIDLIEYSHLIPYESLSGEMNFIQEDAQILTHEWAFMPFGDGSTGGYLLVKFSVDENGHYPSYIEVIDSYLYGEGFK